jgi:hypothetical protein
MQYNIEDTNGVAEAVTAREKVRAENSHDLAVSDQTAALDRIAKVN